MAKTKLATAAVVVICGAVCFGLLRAQSSAQGTFEVASVRRGNSEAARLGPLFLPGGRYRAVNIPLSVTIAIAYGIPMSQADGAQLQNSKRLTGGPEWVRKDGYDIDAVGRQDGFGQGVPMNAQADKLRLMLQALLADRFKLKLRRETKEVPVYELTVGKNGPKIPKAQIDEKDCERQSAETLAQPRLQAPTGGIRCHLLAGGQGRGLHGDAVEMTDVVSFVSSWADKPIIDKTGLKGLYNIQTEGWLPILLGQKVGDNEGQAEEDRPTLFTIFDQMGLKLESRTAPADVYTIESIDRPSEN